MITHLYTITWNEADILGFFFRHYDPWIDRYVIYNNGSTDGTLELLKAHPRVEIRQFEWTVPISFVQSHTEMQNRVWKESRGKADWVIITAIDEHLHVPGIPMRDYLQDCRARGVTLIPAMGYQMVSDAFPNDDELLCETRTMGVADVNFSKLSIFNPDTLKETRFGGGRHHVSPMGELRYPARDRLLLLHYKHLGFERTFARYKEQHAELRPGDLADGLGFHYGWERERFTQEWNRLTDEAIDVSKPGLRHTRHHRATRWWRPSIWARIGRWLPPHSKTD